jgi:hypothetical protein
LDFWSVSKPVVPVADSGHPEERRHTRKSNEARAGISDGRRACRLQTGLGKIKSYKKLDLLFETKHKKPKKILKTNKFLVP